MALDINWHILVQYQSQRKLNLIWHLMTSQKCSGGHAKLAFVSRMISQVQGFAETTEEQLGNRRKDQNQIITLLPDPKGSRPTRPTSPLQLLNWGSDSHALLIDHGTIKLQSARGGASKSKVWILNPYKVSPWKMQRWLEAVACIQSVFHQVAPFVLDAVMWSFSSKAYKKTLLRP